MKNEPKLENTKCFSFLMFNVDPDGVAMFSVVFNRLKRIKVKIYFRRKQF